MRGIFDEMPEALLSLVGRTHPWHVQGLLDATTGSVYPAHAIPAPGTFVDFRINAIN